MEAPDEIIEGSNLLRKVDVYQHLKLSFRNFPKNCKCQKAGPSYYCIPCKVSTCKNCVLSEHINHVLISMREYSFTPEKINEMFTPIETYMKTDPLFIDSNSVRQRLISNLESIITLIHQKADRLKEIKLKEINTMFDNFVKNCSDLKTKLDETKVFMTKYLQKNLKFFNTDPKARLENSDCCNTVFLINYDLLNLARSRSLAIETNSKILDKALKTYQENQLEEGNFLVDEVEKLLFSKFKEIKSKKIVTVQPVDKNNPAAVSVEDQEPPMIKFVKTCHLFSGDLYTDITERINKYNILIDEFKKNCYATISKKGNLREIEKMVNNYEMQKQKGAENLFSKRKIESSKSDLRASSMAYPASKPEEVLLNHLTLMKYFAFQTIDLYGEYFKTETKELQSSHADLMIKLDEDEDKDFGKAIEGTNEVMLYAKKQQKLTKKKLTITRNPFGYTKFPIGCRYILLGDKLYITGGKDETKEYPVVLIYDRKQDKLKRIMDLNHPRSYHTMIFNEIFETIMVLGGENEGSVEIFDPLTNRWQELPTLACPRANSFYYFDESRGYMYSMFGNEGKIMNDAYSDIIEFLDLTNIKGGWLRFDYYLKDNVNLKNYLNIYPLNNELLLIYGGVTGRDNAKTVNVLNLTKKEIGKVDKQLMEALRAQAKNSKKLSSIISSISVNSPPK